MNIEQLKNMALVELSKHNMEDVSHKRWIERIEDATYKLKLDGIIELLKEKK